ncbi:MAG: EamA family transporter, partial [Terriglobales bacterium]
MSSSAPPASRTGIVVASVAIYAFWGSAYLAMKAGLATIPPLVLAGSRLLLAGSLMGGFALLQGQRPARQHWRPLLATAALLFLGGHGLLYWGQTRISSGLAAVLFATIPLWMVLLEGLSSSGIRLGWRTLSGLLLGSVGVLLLVGPSRLLGAGRVDLVGAAAITVAALCWALGSLYATRAALPPSGALAGGLEMLLGGGLLLVLATVLGEFHGFQLGQVSAGSWTAIGYLVLFSSMIGFSCYLWLLKVASPARVSTYAYINPLVAVGLGWALAGEAITPRTLGAIALLLMAVVLIVRAQSK